VAMASMLAAAPVDIVACSEPSLSSATAALHSAARLLSLSAPPLALPPLHHHPTSQHHTTATAVAAATDATAIIIAAAAAVAIHYKLAIALRLVFFLGAEHGSQPASAARQQQQWLVSSLSTAMVRSGPVAVSAASELAMALALAWLIVSVSAAVVRNHSAILSTSSKLAVALAWLVSFLSAALIWTGSVFLSAASKLAVILGWLVSSLSTALVRIGAAFLSVASELAVTAKGLVSSLLQIGSAPRALLSSASSYRRATSPSAFPAPTGYRPHPSPILASLRWQFQRRHNVPDQFFDPGHDYDYASDHRGRDQEQRGANKDTFDLGLLRHEKWKKLGLDVSRYGCDRGWLDTGSGWSIVFHGTSAEGEMLASILRDGLRAPRSTSEIRNGNVHGPGVYCSPSLDVAKRYCKHKWDGKHVVFFCRVKPNALHKATPDIWVVRNDQDIRLVGVLFGPY